MKKTVFVRISCALMMVGTIVFPQGTIAQQTTPRVVATTAWTAAFAYVAGAQQVDLLAPIEMRHPPEYELRATDLQRLSQADLVVYAGYERMVDRLRQAIGAGAVPAVQINTTHTQQIIREAVMAIATALGTEEQARVNLREIDAFYDDWRRDLSRRGAGNHRFIIHNFQVPLMEDLGISAAGRFGPAPLEAQQIVTLSRTRGTIIIDNWHNPVSAPLQESLPPAGVATFLNFPGHGGTITLLDVLAHNRRELQEQF
jgi:hypothetical protein